MNLPQFSLLILDLLDNGILKISMNNGKANALGTEHLTQLANVFKFASNEDKINGILLVSNKEKIYCAGLDLMEVTRYLSASNPEKEFKEFIFDIFSESLKVILQCPKPVASCINGHCLAGGLILALCTDYICFKKDSKIKVGLTELALPVPLPYLPQAITRNRVSPKVSRRMIFDAVVLSPQDMFSFGVGECLSDNTENECIQWLNKKIQMGKVPFGITKQLWWDPVLNGDQTEEQKQLWTKETVKAIAPSSKL